MMEDSDNAMAEAIGRELVRSQGWRWWGPRGHGTVGGVVLTTRWGTSFCELGHCRLWQDDVQYLGHLFVGADVSYGAASAPAWQCAIGFVIPL